MLSAIKLLIALFMIIILPGYLLFKLFFQKRRVAVIESLSLFLAPGIAFFILPMLFSYLFRFSWAIFILFWSGEILIVLFLLFFRRISVVENIFIKHDKYDLLILVMLITVSVSMFIMGGNFHGDATFHLSSIVRLIENINITPTVPMFKDVDQVGFNYAYSIHSGLFAFLQKVSGIELKVIWNLSPGIFSIFIFSAVYFFAHNFFEKKIHIFLTILVFFLYEFAKGWKDFMFLPYPDQIARNVLLFIAFGSIFYSINKKNELFKNSVFIASIAISMMFIHMYSFFAFFFISVFFCLMSIIILKGKENFRKLLFILFLNAVLCLPFLIIRLLWSNYGKIYLAQWFN